MADMTVALLITGKDTASDVVRKLKNNTQSATASMARSFDTLGNRINTTTRILTGMSVAFATWQAKKAIAESAQLDKTLIGLGQSAGATQDKVGLFRKELFNMATQTGQSVDSLSAGMGALVASGNSWDASLQIIKAINPAMAVTGAKAETLADALGVAKQAFGFDLTDMKTSQLLLDKMTVAGRLGNAELENLSGIFAKIGGNAKRANFSFDDTLAFVEQLSLMEKSPERLGTLADSALRLFTTFDYMKQAEKVTAKYGKGTKVNFFDENGARRAPQAIMQDILKQYSKLKTAEQQQNYLGGIFKGMDQETVKGMAMTLNGSWQKSMGDMSKEIAGASGTIAKDLPGAINDAVDQTERLKNALRSAADEFSQPINAAIASGAQTLLDGKSRTGLSKQLLGDKDFSGKEMLVGGAAAVAGALLLARGAGGLSKAIGGKLGSMAAGVAQGKALEAAAGVQPVFVVNWPGSMGGGAGGAADVVRDAMKDVGSGGVVNGAIKAATGIAAAGALTAAAAGAAAVTVGTAGMSAWRMARGENASNWISDYFDNAYGGASGSIGSALYDKFHGDGKKTEVGGELKISVDVNTGKASVAGLKQIGGMDLNILHGPYMPGAGS